jgi:hypothetical protein
MVSEFKWEASMQLKHTALYALASVALLSGFTVRADTAQKEFSQPSYNVLDGTVVNSTLTNIKVVIIKSRGNNVDWSLTFHTHNLTQDTGDGNTSLFVDFIDKSGGTLPGGRVGVRDWRNHCYYNAEGDRSYSGNLNITYSDFVERAAGIKLSDSRPAARVGGC